MFPVVYTVYIIAGSARSTKCFVQSGDLIIAFFLSMIFIYGSVEYKSYTKNSVPEKVHYPLCYLIITMRIYGPEYFAMKKKPKSSKMIYSHFRAVQVI